MYWWFLNNLPFFSTFKIYKKIKWATLRERSFSQRGWEKCSRSNKGVYVCLWFISQSLLYHLIPYIATVLYYVHILDTMKTDTISHLLKPIKSDKNMCWIRHFIFEVFISLVNNYLKFILFCKIWSSQFLALQFEVSPLPNH